MPGRKGELGKKEEDAVGGGGLLEDLSHGEEVSLYSRGKKESAKVKHRMEGCPRKKVIERKGQERARLHHEIRGSSLG